MAYETLIVEIEDYVALIRLNRPEALNALNLKLMRELAAALTAADAERQGALHRADRVGKGLCRRGGHPGDGDENPLSTSSSTTSSAPRPRRSAACASRSSPPSPAIALGGGCELAMMCDFIIAADTAKFGQPEINLGIVAGMGGTQRLTRAVGKSKAMDMHLTGRFMDAAEAERCGLVSRVVPAETLIEEAMKAAGKIAEKSAVTVDGGEGGGQPRRRKPPCAKGLLFERRLFHAMFATEDQKEGMAAFLEKRQPQFRDR